MQGSDPCPPEACDEGRNICLTDTDEDGVFDYQDNCPEHPNGPYLGTCIRIAGGLFVGLGVTCVVNEDCNDDELCDVTQLDFDETGIGDACECRGNFDGDSDIDGNDAYVFKVGFGRSAFFNPCPSNQSVTEEIISFKIHYPSDFVGTPYKLAFPCRELFAQGTHSVEVVGPLIEEKASQVHLGFWDE